MNQLAGHCFHDLYDSDLHLPVFQVTSLHKDGAFESISKFFNKKNWFYVTLCIFAPEILFKKTFAELF